MWQYIATYTISCFLAYLAKKANKREWFVLFSFLALFAGAFLAGSRASTVGSDVSLYGNYEFYLASRSKNLLYLLLTRSIQIEPLYLLLNYVVSRFTNDVHWFYFILQFINITFIYVGIIKNSDKYSFGLSLFTYYTLFYPFSLNGLRQSVALSIVFFGFIYIERRDLKRYLLIILLACGFHYTAICCLFFYLINWIFATIKNKDQITVIICIFLVVFMFFSNYIIQAIALIVPKYIRYFFSGDFTLLLNPILLRLPLFILIVYKRKLLCRYSTSVYFWIVLLFGEIVFSQMRSVMPALYRISFYFGISKISAYSYVNKIFNAKNRMLVNVIIGLYLLVVWYYQTVLLENNEVYPYVSDVFQWLN